jgi:DNA-binding beta-propeller fold protein YncE
MGHFPDKNCLNILAKADAACMIGSGYFLSGEVVMVMRHSVRGAALAAGTAAVLAGILTAAGPALGAAPPAGVINIPTTTPPAQVAFDPADGSVWVTNFNSTTVSEIKHNAVVATYSVDAEQPDGIAIDAVDKTVWVTSAFNDSVIELNEQTGAVLRTVMLTQAGIPVSIAVDPSLSTVFVTDAYCCNVTDPAGYVIQLPMSPEFSYQNVVDVGQDPIGMAVDTTTETVWVANANSDTVSELSYGPDAGIATVATIGVGSDPTNVALDDSTGLVFVTNKNSNNLSVIKESTSSVLHTYGLDGDKEPIGVAVDPSTGYVWVAEPGSNAVSAYSESTGARTARFSINNGPDFLAVDPRTAVYVAYVDQDKLTVLSISPRFTSPTVAHFKDGHYLVFTVRVINYPGARLTERGRLPKGLHFHAGKNQTATISGTPNLARHTRKYRIEIIAMAKGGPKVQAPVIMYFRPCPLCYHHIKP